MCLFTEVILLSMISPGGLYDYKDRYLGFAKSLIRVCLWLLINRELKKLVFYLRFWSSKKKRIKGTEAIDKPVCRWKVRRSQWPVHRVMIGYIIKTSCHLHALCVHCSVSSFIFFLWVWVSPLLSFIFIFIFRQPFLALNGLASLYHVFSFW